MSKATVETGNDILEDHLEHFGVLGMQWGRRKTPERMAKADRKWEDKGLKRRHYMKAYNRAADIFNDQINALNSDDRFRERNLNGDTPLANVYRGEVQKLWQDSLDRASQSLPSNPSETRRWGLNGSDLSNLPVVTVVELTETAHDDSALTIKVNVTRDDLGHILKIETEPITDEMQQTAMGEEFLEHYGVLGMQWGKRKIRKQIRESNKANAKLAKQAKRNANNLTNEELRSVTERINLERSYTSAVGSRNQRNGADKVAKKLNTYANISSSALTLASNVSRVARALGFDAPAIPSATGEKEKKDKKKNKKMR